MDKIKLGKKSEKIQVKMSPWELKTIRAHAKLYARGNVSKWLRFAGVQMGKMMIQKK